MSPDSLQTLALFPYVNHLLTYFSCNCSICPYFAIISLQKGAGKGAVAHECAISRRISTNHRLYSLLIYEEHENVLTTPNILVNCH